MKTLVFKVAGVTFEGRQEHISRMTRLTPVRIVPEPENAYDPNALAVHAAIDGEVKHVGFVPRDLAAEIAPKLDGEAVMCEVRDITGGFETSWGEIAAYGLVLRVSLPEGETA
jgi:hypothetical protein